MGKTVLINPSGREVEVDEDSVPYLTRLNYKEKPTELTNVEQQDASKEEYYDSFGQQLKTVGEGVVSGATLNLADPLMDDEATRERAAAHPGLRVAGEIGGAVGAAILTGGDSLISKAAGLTPAGLVERGAVKAATGLGIESRAARLATTGALEGAGGAVGQNVSAAIMGDPITPEAVVSSIGIGTLLGGTIGYAGGKLADKFETGSFFSKKSKDLDDRLSHFSMDDVHADEVKAKNAFDAEVGDYNQRVDQALAQAKDYVDQRIHKGEWFIAEMNDMDEAAKVDFENRFAESSQSGRFSTIDELDEALIHADTPEERAAYLKSREYDYNQRNIGEFNAARDEVKESARAASGASGISDTAKDFLKQVDDGYNPEFLTGKMRKLAKEHGLPLNADVTPQDIIQGLRKLDVKPGGVTDEIAWDPNKTMQEPEVNVPEHGGTMMEGPADPDSMRDVFMAGKTEWSATKYAKDANLKMAGYNTVKKMLKDAPDLSFNGLKNMSTKQAAEVGLEFFEKMQRLSPDVAKIYDEALAGAFGSTAVVPAEIAQHFKMSQEALEMLGNSGAAKNFIAAWSTVKGMETKTAVNVSESISSAIKQAQRESKALKGAQAGTQQSTGGKGKIGLAERGARVAAGRAASNALGGSAVMYALGYGVADSLMTGGLLGGAAGRMKNLAKTMTKKALTLTAKALSTPGAGFSGAIMTGHDALSTPYGIGDSRENYKGKSKQELFKMRREQATKFQGQYAIDAASQLLGPVSEQSPEIAQKLRDAVVTKANYLANAAPKDPPWAAFDKDYTPSEDEIDRFATVWRAVNEPMSVVQDLAEGYMDPVAAQAFRATSPELHAAIAGYIFQNVEFSELTYQQSLNTSIFLDAPVHADLHCVADYQMDFAEPAEGQAQAQAAQAGAINVSLPDEPTAGERVGMR